MKKQTSILLSVGLMFLSSMTVALATGCTCGPEPIPTPPPTFSGGGFAFASFGNGAFFTWDTYVPPVIAINTNGTSTTIATQAGYFRNGGVVAGVSKFKFNNDLYVWTSKNKISPDVSELQKVLVAEVLLSPNSTTGVYDETTRAAVEAFQKKHNIHPAPQYPYGYFGPLTRAFVNSH